ncbi:PTS lactose/cellobiose transporter subunit IIA [Bombilactobacillus bombi]|uniref:PTS lactose/cellobiose transporter subunit IIA n=1 Tax=Bombilactobacillus bombi TaxID=1303590 RepID=A0A417ZEC4_9LACO|nr:PTS lactose/cellobiose transporter subunit IIA [Bombilactobacillus bombi]RHW49556.1 PTS lactose/cellobiose transporter subunit IIA [Bombilactobacillus bombi]
MEKSTKSQELISVSMQIIMHAGNAKNLASSAFEAAKTKNFKKAQEQIDSARSEITSAHNAQTNIIQSEAKGVVYDYSPLFAHAQDTLMTISSEMNNIERMIEVLKILFEKEENYNE